MSNLERHIDGDAGFFGIDTRTNPSSLKSGVLQDGMNIRLDLNTIQVRKGFARMLTDTLASTIGTVYGSGIYVQPDGTELIVLVVETGIYFFDILTEEVVSPLLPFPETNATYTSGIYTFNFQRKITSNVKVLQADNKIYILRGEANRYLTGDGTSNITGRVVSSGHLATVYCTEPHGLSAGDEFIIETPHIQLNGPTTYNPFVVKEVINGTRFTYSYTDTHTGNGAYVIQVANPVFCWDGISNHVDIVKQGVIDGTVFGNPTQCDFPPTSTAIYHKNRIYCKYSKDEIAVSDYLPDTSGNWVFDLTIQALTINQGDEQDIVGFHPWTKDEILVFKTNSIYSAKFSDNPTSPEVVLSTSYVRSLTFDIGCSAQQSIANVSGNVFFLSKRGVFLLEPQLDTNLLSNTTPMSADIQKYFNRINQKHISKSIGKVFNGRYYLAVPLDSSTINNCIFIYSLINKMWESIDTFPSQIAPNGLMIARYDPDSTESRLFLWTNQKGLFLFEENENDEFGELISGIPLEFFLPRDFGPNVYESSVINGRAITRRFIYNTLQQKRFVSVNADMDFNGQGVVQTTLNTYNQDTSNVLDISTSALQEDKTRRFPVRKVATGAEIQFDSLQGTPTIKSISIEAAIVGRNLKNSE